MEQIHLYVNSKLKTEIEKKAAEKGLSVNAFIRMIIIEKIKEL
jgi:predicted HicB family RNase H-like nuclease